MEKIKDFFKSRSVGFYVLLAALLLSLAEVIAYTVLYGALSRREYASVTAMWLPYLAIIAAAAMSLFKQTRSFAPLALFAVQVGSFMSYIDGTYLYFSNVFYGGFSMKALAAMDGAVIFCVVMFLCVFIASGIATFMSQCKEDARKKNTSNTAKEELA